MRELQRPKALPPREFAFYFGNSWGTTVSAECFDAAENRGGRFAGNGLVSNGFYQDFVRTLGGTLFDSELPGLFDQGPKERVLRRQGIHGEAQVKRRQVVFRDQCMAPSLKRATRLASSGGEASQRRRHGPKVEDTQVHGPQRLGKGLEMARTAPVITEPQGE